MRRHRFSGEFSFIKNELRNGMRLAYLFSMKNSILFTFFLILPWSASLPADDQNPQINVNERYEVESVTFSGIDESNISELLRHEAQEMVGEKYSEKSAHDLAKKLGEEMPKYSVTVKVERGKQPEHVHLEFQFERIRGFSLGFNAPWLVYHSKEGFSGAIEIPYETHHHVFAFGLVTDAEQLLERNAGLRLRYEHRKLGTDRLQLRMDFDSYHQSFNSATESALAQRPDVPGVYRARQNFAPSLSLHPALGWMLSAGVSFQRMQQQYPAIHTETAYAGTADIQYERTLESSTGYEQNFGAHYSLRTATRILDSDYVYTRHLVTADYSLSKGRSLFGAHFIGGYITGTAPLFERFSFGNSTTLRGWNKFDVAPLGGTRAAHASLEYRYSYFQIFYDVGAVWDLANPKVVRHGLGFGLATKPMIFGSKFFASLAFPVRLHNVAPVFMMGLRF
jgi:hypothetical protein